MDPTIEPTAIIERPKEVSSAVQFLAASFVIGGIRAVFDLKQKVSGGSFLVAVLLLVLFLGVCFFFVYKIAAGRNWARITLLALILIQLPFTILGSIGELRTNLPHGSISIVIAILQLIGTFLLFTKDSNSWFRTRK